MSDIQTKIKQNQNLGRNIEDILSQLEIPDNNQKALFFTAFLRNGLSHFSSMNLLIEEKLYHSAFAFARVFFDNILRGEYSIYILDDTKIDEMFSSSNDWKFVTKEMCQKLDEFFGSSFFENIRQQSYGIMCDFTHTSNNQISRYFNEEKSLIESNFTDDEVLDLLKGNYNLMKRFAKNYIAFMKAHNLLNDGINL
jgi:hypothetical protein